jgi:hypothetical protein
MNEILGYLLRSGASLALFFAFYWLFLRKETFHLFNRFYLLAAAALSLALPLVRMTSPFFTTVIPASSLETSGMAVPIPPPTSINPLSLLLAGYLAGTAFFLLRFLFRLASLFLVARKCGCRRHDGLRIVLCGHHGEPFSFFHYIFIDRTKLGDGDIDRILAHEMVHVRGLHSLDIVLSELVTIVQWFNPFVWPYKRSLRETHEYLADRAVIAQGCSLARYQLLIVEQHVGGELFELASSFRTSQIKRRITMLSKQESKGLTRLKPLLILPLALVLVLAFAESKTVVQDDLSTETRMIKAGPAPQDVSEEEMIKELRAKFAKLEEMRDENLKRTEILKKKLESTTDADTQKKIQQLLKEQKYAFMEIEAKSMSLQMKKGELALAKETSAEKKDELKKMLAEMKAKEETLKKKIEEARKAEANGKEKVEKK